MKRNKIIIFSCTIVLLIGVCLICLYQLADHDELPFAISIPSGDETETICCWNNGKGESFVFVPGYITLSEAVVELNTGSRVALNGVPLSDGMSCGAFELDVQYECTYAVFGKTHRQGVTFVRSGYVGTMYIDTDSGNMEYIHAKKGNEESGTIRLYSSEGILDYRGELNAMNGRGNSTWQYFDKKSYSLTLAHEADLLNLGKAQKWILLSNAADSSNLRNKLVFEFAAKAGLAYSPDCQWVDLYLNGEYAGLYLLAERNEVHPERVNISNQTGFLVSMEMRERLDAQNYSYIQTDAAQTLRVHYPTNPSNASFAELENIWQSVENAILAEDGIDPVTGKAWQELIDLDSWARKFIIEEIFGNNDACFVSQYFYCDGEDGKIFAGPVWDYDLSMGCDFVWHLANSCALFANRLQARPGYVTPWFYSLFQKDDFYHRVVELYQDQFLPLLKELLNDDVNAYAASVSTAAAMDHIRWDDEVEDVFEQAKYIVNYMEERITVFNNIWVDRTPYFRVQIDQGFGSSYAHYVVYEGECLEFLPTLEDTENSIFCGWYYADTNEPFDATKPITGDITVCAKWEDSASNKLDNIIKIVPIGVMAVMFIGLFVVEVKRIKRNGR